MRRLRHGFSERGLSGIITALLLIAFCGFAAIAVDLGALWFDRKQAQNGADAAALAIAQICAADSTAAGCRNYSTADSGPDSPNDYASKNKVMSQAFTGSARVDVSAGRVTADVGTTQNHWFAPLLGITSSNVSARAVASWGGITGGGVTPITFSWCEFYRQTGGWNADGTPINNTEINVLLSTHDTCSPPAHDELPGGFGWLYGPNCSATVYPGNWIVQDPGNDGSNSCRNFDFTTLRNQVIKVPIFEEYDAHYRPPSGSPTKAYRIKGIAAFKVTGYCFASHQQWNATRCPADKSIKGYFQSYQDLSGDYTPDPTGTHFGVTVVKLIG